MAGPCLRRPVRTAVERQLGDLDGLGGTIKVEGERWAWALPMRSLEGAFGHVVIAGEGPIQDTEQFLLGVFAQQVGIAVANADIHAREHATAEELGIVNIRLERSLAIHSRFTEAAVEGRGVGELPKLCMSSPASRSSSRIHKATCWPRLVRGLLVIAIRRTTGSRSWRSLPASILRPSGSETDSQRCPATLGSHSPCFAP